jgi:hypothetical protein
LHVRKRVGDVGRGSPSPRLDCIGHPSPIEGEGMKRVVASVDFDYMDEDVDGTGQVKACRMPESRGGPLGPSVQKV